MSAELRSAVCTKLILLILTALFVAGCTNPFGMSEPDQSPGHGSLLVSATPGDSSVGAQTIFPVVSMSQIESYRVELTDGPAADVAQVITVSDEDGAFPSDFAINDLVPGTWKLRVEAFDEEDPDDAPGPLVRGTRGDVKIEAGVRTEIEPVALRYLDDCDGDDCDPGYLDLTVTWPEEEEVDRLTFIIEDHDGDDDVDRVDDSLTDDRFEEKNDSGRWSRTLSVEDDLDSDDDINEDNRYFTDIFEADTEIDAGWYWISIRFERDGDPDDDEDRDTSTYMVHELVYVRPNVTTAASIDIDDIPLEVRYAQEVEDSVQETVDEDGNFDEVEDLGFAYTGSGGEQLSIDTSDIQDDTDISFKLRNESENIDGDDLLKENIVERFNTGVAVEVLLDGDDFEGDEFVGTYHPPFAYDDGPLDEVEDAAIVPAETEDEVSLNDLQHVIENEDEYDGLDDGVTYEGLDTGLVKEGDFKGFLAVTFSVPSEVDEIVFDFAGGDHRKYTFGNFEVELAD